MSKLTKKQQAERQEAIDKLREMLKPGDTVYTILRHVSRSGMRREISIAAGDVATASELTWLAAVATGDRIGKHAGIIIDGCGMDMGFSLVYNLSSVLYPRDRGWQCAGEQCGSNDHSNPPYPERDGKMLHEDGGYALRQRWI